MEAKANEYQPKESTYDQIASLADTNVLQVEVLEQNLAAIQVEKESLRKEVVALQSKVEHSAKAVEDAQVALSCTESNINQLKQDILTKKETNSKTSLVISSLGKEIQATRDAIEEKRSQFIDQHEASARELAALPLVGNQVMERVLDGVMPGESPRVI